MPDVTLDDLTKLRRWVTWRNEERGGKTTDAKGMPPEVRDRLDDLGGFRVPITSVCPELLSAGSVVRESTSSGLLRSDTEEVFPGSGGAHWYIHVKDGGDAERFLKTVHDRLWLKCLGWLMVGKGGQLLERSLVDRTVYAPERLVFEGAPQVVPPLVQDKRQPYVIDGSSVDTIRACPNLNPAERSTLEEMKAAARHRLAKQADQARADFIAHRVDQVVKRCGVSRIKARQIVEKQCEGILLPAHESVNAAVTDHVTLVEATGRVLAKTVLPDGTIKPFDNARTFNLYYRRVSGLADFDGLLRAMLDKPSFGLVRGAIINRQQRRRVRRLLERDPETGDEPTLCAAGHYWIALDVEKVEKPPSVEFADLPACAHEAIKLLPLQFHEVECIAVATASHGLKSDIRLRLVFWADRPLADDELKRWLRPCGVVDCALFNPIQLHYTAAPIFPNGCDHLPNRIIMLPGKPVLVAPAAEDLAAPPPRPMPPLPKPGSFRASSYAVAALRKAGMRIASATPSQRHNTIVKECLGLRRFVEGGLLSEREIAAIVVGAAELCGKDPIEVQRIIEWVGSRQVTPLAPKGDKL